MEVPVFEDWEVDALENEIQAEWRLDRAYYIDAAVIEVPLPAPATND